MINKIMADEIKINQDDLDYLKYRACYCLEQEAKSQDITEKRRYYKLFLAYYELYQSQKKEFEDREFHRMVYDKCLWAIIELGNGKTEEESKLIDMLHEICKEIEDNNLIKGRNWVNE